MTSSAPALIDLDIELKLLNPTRNKTGRTNASLSLSCGRNIVNRSLRADSRGGLSPFCSRCLLLLLLLLLLLGIPGEIFGIHFSVVVAVVFVVAVAGDLPDALPLLGWGPPHHLWKEFNWRMILYTMQLKTQMISIHLQEIMNL